MKHLPKVRIIALKSVRKYPTEKSSHHIKISQLIYNVTETSGFGMIEALDRKTLREKL